MSELSVGQLRGLTVNSNVITVPSGHKLYAPGHVVQVISVTKSDTFAMSSSTFTDITGLSATIIPQSSNSKIYVSVTLVSSQNVASTATNFLLLRDSTQIAIGDAASNRVRVTSSSYAANSNEVMPVAITFLDSPSTTSPLAYKMQMRSSINGVQSVINRSNGDGDSNVSPRSISTITLMEIAQ